MRNEDKEGKLIRSRCLLFQVMKRRGAASLKVGVQDCHHLCRDAPLMSLR